MDKNEFSASRRAFTGVLWPIWLNNDVNYDVTKIGKLGGFDLVNFFPPKGILTGRLWELISEVIGV